MIPSLVRVSISRSARGWIVDAALSFDDVRHHGDLASECQLDFSSSPLGLIGDFEGASRNWERGASESWQSDSAAICVPYNFVDPIVLRLEWVPGLAIAPRNARRDAWGKTPCLVLPDMLPSIHSVAAELNFVSTSLPRIVFDEPLPEHLSSGGVLEASGSDRFLQAVVFDSRLYADPFNEFAIALDPALADDVNVDGAYEYLRLLAQFVRTEMEVSADVRPVAFLTDSANDYTCAGAFFAARPGDVGGLKPSKGKPVQAIRFIAQSWLGAGTRISGRDAVVLELGLGGALGLRWLAETNHQHARRQLLDQMRINVAEASNTATWSTALRVQELEASLAIELDRPRVRRLISEVVADHWGLFLPQERIVETLLAAGVRLPKLTER